MNRTELDSFNYTNINELLSPLEPSIQPTYLETIIDKKVKDIALTCFESLVHWFLTTFSCFYPAYNRLYKEAEIAKLSSTNTDLPDSGPSLSSSNTDERRSSPKNLTVVIPNDDSDVGETTPFIVEDVSESESEISELSPLKRIATEVEPEFLSIQQEDQNVIRIEERVQNDEELAPFAAQPSDEPIKTEEDVWKAIEQNGLALESADEVLKRNKALVLAAVKNNVQALKFASPLLTSNQDFMLDAIELNWNAFPFSSQELQNNYDFVLAAVNKNGWILAFAREDYKNNENIVLAAVKNKGTALRYASKDIKNNKKVVNAAVRQDGYALQFASGYLKGDYYTVLAAILQCPSSRQFADSSLENDPDLNLDIANRRGLKQW